MNRNSRLTTAVTLALQAFALPVAAEVVLFDNTDGAFQWLPSVSGFPFNYFDPTQPPTQSGLETTNSLWYSPVTQATSESFYDGEFIGLGEIKIAVGDLIAGGTKSFLPPQQFRAGEEIGADADWRERADHSWHISATSRIYWTLNRR